MRQHNVICKIENLKDISGVNIQANKFWRDVINNYLRQAELSDEEKLQMLNQLISELKSNFHVTEG